MMRHPNPESELVAGVHHQMEVLQLSVSKRRLSSSNKSAKLHSRSVDDSMRSLGKLHRSSSCNMRMRSSGNLPIENKRNNSLCSRRRRSLGNPP
jgi:hypothetical protein